VPFVTCPNCEREHKVPRSALGMRTECPKCGESFRAEEDENDEEQEDEYERPSRRSHKGAGRGIWTAVIVIGSIAAAIFIIGLLGWATASKQTADGVTTLTREEYVDLNDHPERYKGKTLRLLLTVETGISARNGDSLRNYSGQDVRFYGFGMGRGNVDLVIQMPKKGDLPNAHGHDDLVVTFICRNGQLQSGNEVKFPTIGGQPDKGVNSYRGGPRWQSHDEHSHASSRSRP
jgi:hypothetical protein